MITQVKNKFFNILVVNFENYVKYENIIKFKGCDFVQILGNETPIEGAHIICKEQATLLTDLSLPTDDIWKKFRSNYRNEIRKAGRRGVLVRQYTGREINGELIADLTVAYEKMFKDKGISRKMPVSQLNAYIDSGFLVMTVAHDENGNRMVYHTYITDFKNVKLWQSCSLFRTKDKKYRNYVGMVNKHLHWEDIKYFSSRGCKLMDWGGVDFSTSEHGIGDFKHGFGGEFVKYYNINYEASLKSRMYSKLKVICK